MNTATVLPNGKIFDFCNMDFSVIDLEDIATSLAHTIRFNGYWGNYTVAQHSVLVSRCVKPELALAALFHDAAEFLTGDIITPYKNVFNGIAHRNENRILDGIFTRFSIPLPDGEGLKNITHVDKRMYLTEVAVLTPPHIRQLPIWKECLGVELEPYDKSMIGKIWDSHGAEFEFLDEAERLLSGVNIERK